MANVTIRKAENLEGQVQAPPSKAYTQRMLIAASLSNGKSQILKPLSSEDTEATLRAVTALGVEVKTNQDGLVVQGTGLVKSSQEPIDCGESGATLRFMIPVAALAPEPSVFLLGKGLAKRPIDPLLLSLKRLGVKSRIQKTSDKTYVQVEGGGICGGKTSMPGDVSSQFVSGLMFACPLAETDTNLTMTSPLESSSYVLMTKDVLQQHHVRVDVSDDFSAVTIPAGQAYRPFDGRVPGDFSSAAFLLAAAAITKSRVKVSNLDQDSVQGDKAIARVLERMGVNVTIQANQIEIEGSGNPLLAADVDSRDIPDLVPACASLACFAEGATRIFNAQRLRLKESDRLTSLFTELRKMGADITIDAGSLVIRGPSSLHGAVIDPHDDHRIAMACAVAALGAEGETVIENAECVRKSYPQFFTDLRALGADVVDGQFDR